MSTTEFQESDTPVARRAKAIKRSWFNTLPQPKRDEIIEREFESSHPTDSDKRKAAADYDERHKRQQGWFI